MMLIDTSKSIATAWKASVGTSGSRTILIKRGTFAYEPLSFGQLLSNWVVDSVTYKVAISRTRVTTDGRRLVRDSDMWVEATRGESGSFEAQAC